MHTSSAGAALPGAALLAALLLLFAFLGGGSGGGDPGAPPPAVRAARIAPPSFPAAACAAAASAPLRFPRAQRLAYASNFSSVKGWMNPAVAHLAAVLSDAQSRAGICGAAGEIGVHHGKFSIALAHALRAGERSVAVDVFENQELNVDGSGNGDRAVFEGNLRRFGVEPGEDVRMIAGSSDEVVPAQLVEAAGGSMFRLFSVDGGHTAELAENDLRLAAAVCVDGCVVFLDDFLAPEWPGVTEGLVSYLRTATPSLVPFLAYTNKLLLTTPSFHARWTDAVASHAHFGPRAKKKPRRVALGGTAYLLGPPGFYEGEGGEKEAWIKYVEGSGGE
ncbi:hypothetical protein DFJ74DRAFT_702411 [Hyaloraphidium curvatum]|nr:hypothetical protein DFJ74DRAFT_702411 [Hyaloraphidium curvatum]